MPWYNDRIPDFSAWKPERVRREDGLTITGDLSLELLTAYGWYYQDDPPRPNTGTDYTEVLE